MDERNGHGANGAHGTRSHKSSHVDLLISGAGPAGLMMATCMARMGIKTRIVDKRGTMVFNGQADGLQARTLEVFDSLGFVEDIIRVSAWYYEFSSWGSSEDGGIERKSINTDPLSGAKDSRFSQHVLNQGYIEQAMLDTMKKYSDIEVERGVLPCSINFDESKADKIYEYPITVELQHLYEEETRPFQTSAHTVGENGHQPSDGLFRSNLAGDDTEELIAKVKDRAETRETVHAKFMLGAEGAHSWTRRQLGYKMEGESTDFIWGVLDIIPLTDFPDIRRPGTIQTKDHGSMLIIPREKKLVRLYTQLQEVTPEHGYVDRTKITPDQILAGARKIFHPYKMDYSYCDWWTAYQVGQRIGERYSNASNRIILAGDAVHTHSPKAGQGMNVSMQDAFNLSWKLAGVLKGDYDPVILDTYELERKGIAHQLIDFDHFLSRRFSGSPTEEELIQVYKKNRLFVSGVGLRYPPSSLIAHYTVDAADTPLTTTSGAATAYTSKTSKPPPIPNPIAATSSLLAKVPIGYRFGSAQVLRHADARPFQFQHWLRADGRWRLIVFAGNVARPAALSRLNALGAALAFRVFPRYTRVSASAPVSASASTSPRAATAPRPTCLLEPLVLHCARPRHEVEITDFHDAFFPLDAVDGRDYDRVFADDVSGYDGSGGVAYEDYGVDREEGCMVLVRPDQYVAWVGKLEDVEGLEGFLEGAGWRAVV